MRRIILEILFIQLLSLSCNAQFNRKYNLDIQYKELGSEICITTKSLKTEIKIGIEFLLESPNNQNVQLDQKWIFPRELSDGKGNNFKEVRTTIQKPTNENNYSTYSINENYDLVKGKWKYKVYYNGKPLYEKEFWIE